MDVLKFSGVIVYLLTLVHGELIVETSTGKVRGVEVSSIIKNEKFYSFFSIPYAEPPTGANRFMAPKPHSGWEDILENKKEKKPCAHLNLPYRPIKNYGFSGSEDCLFLSVHTPRLPTNNELKMPVIVFLYNENFQVAYNASKEYGPDFFMKEEVIIVTLQHRLGALGFLSFNDNLLPGNNGLRDVLLALKWIQTNIHKFGGDPQKITLMGSEGGAVIVDLLLHSPKAKGLFRAAIMQSETSWNSLYLHSNKRERAIALSEAIDEHATTSSFLLKRLSHVSADKISQGERASVHADEARTYQRGVIPFGPVVEHDHPDAIITEYPENKAIDIDIPILIGYNSRESIESCYHFLKKPTFLTYADRDLLFLFPYRVNHYFEMNSQVYMKAQEEIKNHYFDEGYIKISKPGEYITYIQDLLVFYPLDYAVRKYINESMSSVYYYTFDFSGDFNLRKQINLKEAVTIDGTWGAAPGDELCYLFVCKALKKSYKKAMEDPNSEEMKVISNMVRLWSNFAKTGNPTPPGDEIQWKPATKENKECLVINDEPELKTRLYDETVTFWDNFLEKYSKLAKDGVIKDLKDEL
ncbi:unnamed protein product [Diatraea saccharalis]|uniref:Carboxylesterase type B domain-containing protein n=1 Tax=Diatraea saccharalis TaxID=40085 RepID=A0A9N9WJI4_9NEOP|nr:unnamed protein product [Diatraea saccharalis]